MHVDNLADTIERVVLVLSRRINNISYEQLKFDHQIVLQSTTLIKSKNILQDFKTSYDHCISILFIYQLLMTN